MVNINEIGEGVTPYKFSIGEETKYGMDYNFHTEDGDAYLVQFDEGNFSDVYDLAFYAVGSSGFMSDEEMNKGRQFKIISTVLAIIKDFIKETPGVQGIEFSGKKKEGKETNQRDLLYNAYVKKHIGEFPGWDFKIGNNETKLFKKETLKESKPLTGLSQFLVESFLQEVNEKYNEVIGLFPGGYKPPTIAHFHIVDEISKRPEITKLKVLIGPKERDNITSEQSLQIWNIYKKYLNNKVEFEKSSISPVKDVLDIIKNNPQNYYILVVGRDEDYNRFKSADKYNNIKIVSIKEAGEGISGTKARQEILSDNYINFQKYIPTELTLKERGEIWNILTKNKQLNEGKQVGLLYHYTSADGLKGILSSNRINASEEYYLGVILYYISFTRNKNFHNKKQKFRVKTNYRITLDGDKLSNKYKITPFSYKPGWDYENNWEYDWLEDEPESVVRDFFNNTGDYDEQEERISFKGPEGGIDNIKNYILHVDKVEDLQEKTIQSFNLQNVNELENNEIKYWANYFNIFNKLKENPNKIYNILKLKLKGEQLEALLYFYDFLKQEDKKILKEEIMTRDDLKKYSNDIKIKEYIDKLMDYCCNDLGIKKPKLNIVGEEYTKENKSFGGYSPQTNEIFLMIKGRNLTDVLRSCSHELKHCQQNFKGELTSESGKDGDKWENEANSYSGKTMRIFGRENPEIYTITC